uniref:Multidrug resistance-associated protein 1-like n=1 Tax=Saccoglossus kowalevskii TaxID=10224 RepID=A0ABM0GWV9_SACKO
IDIDITEGSLVAVVGQVGSGKSSLLSALLGEMEKLDGKVFMKGSVAYVAQQAWIQNTTLQNNILFGTKYIQKKYNKIVDCCALTPDIAVLPGGDQTEIGEKGINLSGGQKQRVSLARSVYSNSDIYLLDDPLSAVDAHVGKHIFDHVIGPTGLLKKKTRILVTHGLSFLPQVDKIIVLVDGRITEVGSFKELLNKDEAFAEFLRNYSSDADDNQAEEDEAAVLSLSEEIHNLSEMRSLTTVSMGDKDGHPSSLHSDSLSMLERKSSKIHLQSSLKEEKEKKMNMEKAEETKLVQKEKSETGHVKFNVFWAYIKSMGILLTILVCFLYSGNTAFAIRTNFWLARWSQEPTINGTQDPSKRDLYLGVYGALGICQAILAYSHLVLFYYSVTQAGKHLHSGLLQNILHCPMQFFESVPLGRVLNRFSSDIDTLDVRLPMTLLYLIMNIAEVLSVLLVICISTVIFLVIVPPLLILYFLVQ